MARTITGGRAGPVFLYGALRSGTTLFRIILDGHSGLSNPGESDFLFDYIHPDPTRPTGWRYDVEGLRRDRIFRARQIDFPENKDGLELLNALVQALAAKGQGRLVLMCHRHAAKIARIFPNSQVIHLLRDPRDVARSSVGMRWAGNSFYGIDHWIATEQGWDGAGMVEPQTLTLSFEALMEAPESELSRVCRFLDISYEPEMLNYPVRSSYGPPDPKISQQWRRKAGAREVARIEARAGTLLEARGYVRAGPQISPGWGERGFLAIDNRVRRWRANIRFFGARLFLGRHFAKALRLRTLERRLAQQQEDIVVRNIR